MYLSICISFYFKANCFTVGRKKYKVNNIRCVEYRLPINYLDTLDFTVAKRKCWVDNVKAKRKTTPVSLLKFIFILCVMFKTDFYERGINTQLPLRRYQSRVNLFAVMLKKIGPLTATVDFCAFC